MMVNRRAKGPALRHALAVRDGLARLTWGKRGPMWVYQCASCSKLLRTSRLTVAHIQPKSKGGSNDENNLRAECWPCNYADSLAWGSNSLSSEQHVRKALTADRHCRLRRKGIRGPFLKTYLPGGPPPCVRCGITIGLIGFNPSPHWHPSYERARDTLEVHPVCADCNEEFEIAYALKITPMVQDILEASRNHHKALSARLSVAMEAWNRKDHGEALKPTLAARYQRLHGPDPRTQDIPALWETAQAASRRVRSGNHPGYC